VLQRQAALQEFSNKILSNHFVRTSLAVRRFFDPQNYSQNFQGNKNTRNHTQIQFKYDFFSEIALQNVALVFRNNTRYKILQAIPEVGWRFKKIYIEVYFVKKTYNFIAKTIIPLRWKIRQIQKWKSG